MDERWLELHLLYASIVWLAAWLLTSLRRGSATTKYWIWVATSVNFMLPLSAIPVRFWPAPVSWFTSRLTDVAQAAPSPTAPLLALWAIGAAAMCVRLVLRIHADARATSDGPAVNGILRSRISLPAGIERLLTRRELDAVLIHEQRHAERRDNLIRLVHELSLCALWFHPFVWVTRSRLALYRELSCDEAVTQRSLGDALISALAKLANGDEALLLQATASSFIGDRLARLTAPRRPGRITNAILAAIFGIILCAAATTPVAQICANDACRRTHAVRGGVNGGVQGGVAGGVKGGVAGGVSGGIKGGVAGGVQGGIR